VAPVRQLADFLIRRYDEEEAAARAAEHPDGPQTLQWRRGGKRVLHFDNGCREEYESVYAGDWARILVARDSIKGGPLAEHIARHDPAAVLANLASKRRLVAYAVANMPRDDLNPRGSHGIDLLMMLAIPYVEHPEIHAVLPNFDPPEGDPR
jgi:hypothetical protein